MNLKALFKKSNQEEIINEPITEYDKEVNRAIQKLYTCDGKFMTVFMIYKAMDLDLSSEESFFANYNFIENFKKIRASIKKLEKEKILNLNELFIVDGKNKYTVYQILKYPISLEE